MGLLAGDVDKQRSRGEGGGEGGCGRDIMARGKEVRRDELTKRRGKKEQTGLHAVHLPRTAKSVVNPHFCKSHDSALLSELMTVSRSCSDPV